MYQKLNKIRSVLQSHYLNVSVIVLVVISTLLVTISLIINLELISSKKYPVVSSLKLTGASNII